MTKAKTKPKPKPHGRPSSYSETVVERICSEIASGKSLRTICKADGMPDMATVFRWIPNHDGFREQYALAMEQRADAIFEDTLEIADDATNDWMATNDPENPGYRLNGEHVQRSRLRVDTRKWFVGKLQPKKYGEHQDITGTFAVAVTNLSELEIAQRVAHLLMSVNVIDITPTVVEDKTK